MKVPTNIKKAIKDMAKASEKAREADNIIRKWLLNNNMSNDHAFDMLIDCCEIGNDPDTFIYMLENDQVAKGNEDMYNEE